MCILFMPMGHVRPREQVCIGRGGTRNSELGKGVMVNGRRSGQRPPECQGLVWKKRPESKRGGIGPEGIKDMGDPSGWPGDCDHCLPDEEAAH